MDSDEIIITAIVGLIVAALVGWSLRTHHKHSQNPSNAPEDGPGSNRSSAGFKSIPDTFKSIQEVTVALRKAGLESSDLIVGVDFTKSNEWTGEKSFGGRCLHDIDLQGLHSNPYQMAIRIVGSTLEAFDDDGEIPAFGFGCAKTKDRTVFPFNSDNSPCLRFAGVLQRYTQILTEGSIKLSGPTSFAPLIRRAIEIVQQESSFHILLIIADGQVTSEAETVKAIVEASSFPLSIILVGVGDGPWDMMREFDDGLPERRFDNFQFVPYEEIKASCTPEQFEAKLALGCLMEIPEQYKELRKQGLLLERSSECAVCAPAAPEAQNPTPDVDDLPSPPDLKAAAWQKGKEKVELAAGLSTEEDPPENFLCPITQEIMKAPVVCADGYTYEESAIKNWFQNKRTSPMNNRRIDAALIPNHSLRSQIMEWRMNHPNVE